MTNDLGMKTRLRLHNKVFWRKNFGNDHLGKGITQNPFVRSFFFYKEEAELIIEIKGITPISMICLHFGVTRNVNLVGDVFEIMHANDV